MRKITIGLCVAMLTLGWAQAGAGRPGADGAGDPYFPGLGNGGYDALHYTLDLTWDADTNKIAGTATMEAQAKQDLSAFNLDFEGFTISTVQVNGKAADFERNQRELTIKPATILPDEKPFTSIITYSGVPGEGVPGYYDVFARGWTRYDKGVYVASEPNGAAFWYPVNDHPLDKATYTYKITVPNPYIVAANGQLKDVQKGDKISTYTWSTRDPLASYLAMVNIGDFVVQNAESATGIPIRNYFPSNLSEKATSAFSRLPDMVDYFSKIFGAYPFEAYGVVVADTDLSFALETQTMSLFGRSFSSRRNSNAEVVIAHELAHQWFGDSVSLTRWKDIWLNEGFATYASELWLENSAGRDALDKQMRDYYGLLANPALVGGSFSPPGNPPQEDLFNGGVYIRGAWTLHALRLHVGDAKFYKILQTYYNTYKMGNATTEDFIQVASDVSQEDLKDFFDGWLMQKNVPDVPEMGLKRVN